MTPEELAKSGTEHGHQSALFCWAQLNLIQYPMLRWMFAIPNGGSRGATVQAAKAIGGMLKAEGVKAGVSDICLPWPAKGMHGLFLEMKKPGGTASKEQLAFGSDMQDAGYGFCICDNWEKARNVLIEYLS